MAFAVLAVILLLRRSPDNGESLTYTEFRAKVAAEDVREITYDNNTGNITGEFDDGSKFHTTGLRPFPEADQKLLQANGVDLSTKTPVPQWWETWLPPCCCPCSSSCSSCSSAGPRGRWATSCRSAASKAKTYSTERPGTTFADVAGYEGVKTEIREVVDFLKYPEKLPCIIFIDEIDAVGRHRGAGLGGGHDEREQTPRSTSTSSPRGTPGMSGAELAEPRQRGRAPRRAPLAAR